MIFLSLSNKHNQAKVAKRKSTRKPNIWFKSKNLLRRSQDQVHFPNVTHRRQMMLRSSGSWKSVQRVLIESTSGSEEDPKKSKLKRQYWLAQQNKLCFNYNTIISCFTNGLNPPSQRCRFFVRTRSRQRSQWSLESNN